MTPPGRSDLLAALLTGVHAEMPGAVDLRHRLHAHPCLSGEEAPASLQLAESLGRPVIPVADTGFLVRTGPTTGPAIAIRAELDALPITETTGVPWAAGNAAMHACGHDVHQAALVALTRAADRLELPAALLSVFQPREETYPSGARDIVESGLLQAHHVGAAVAVHVQPRVEPGEASTGAGAVNAAADEFHIVIRGHGGHGAYPHVAADPVPAFAQLLLALHQLVGRRVNPVHPATLTVGALQAGASANVIPEEASLRGTLRTMDEHDRDRLHDDLRAAAEHTARAHGATAQTTITRGEPVLVNDPALVQHTDPLLRQVGFGAADPLRSCGSDDFSYYTQACPALMIFLGVHSEGATQRQPGLHHPRFLPPDQAVGQVAAAMAAGYAGALHALGLTDAWHAIVPPTTTGTGARCQADRAARPRGDTPAGG
jgi:amidohydrolase